MAELDYITTINLKNTEKYQLVYASQEYGSFYCIFAKFVKSGENKYDITFDCRTYKGSVKIGIESVIPKESNTDNNIHHIQIFTNANIQSASRQKPLKNITLKSNDLLIFERISAKTPPNHIVSEEDFINIPPKETGANRTHYQLERDIVENLIQAIKNPRKDLTDKELSEIKSAIKSASASYCVIGFSKLVEV